MNKKDKETQNKIKRLRAKKNRDGLAKLFKSLGAREFVTHMAVNFKSENSDLDIENHLNHSYSECSQCGELYNPVKKYPAQPETKEILRDIKARRLLDHGHIS